MTQDAPHVSLIIPTHNHADLLRRTLDALRAQTYPLQCVEVVVVTDGCTDGTAELLRRYEAPFALRVIEQSNCGPAVARNHGAAQARGRLLIFLDDDIEATPSLIEAHVRAHECQPTRVAMGYLPPTLERQTGFFRIALRTWWEAMFRAMRQPGNRYAYSDLLSGNFSLEADLFARVGGFDAALRCHEDYELGMRLLKAGASFTFAPDAVGYHLEKTDLDRSLQRKYQEGRADVLIGQRHPELRPVLPLACIEAPGSSLGRILRRLAFTWPTAGDTLATCLRRLLNVLERLRLRGRWGHLLDELLGYWYWRGVSEQLGTRQALVNFLQGGIVRADGDAVEVELDLRAGLEASERLLDEVRPAGARIYYGQQPIGYIPPQLGTERLRGAHLRPFLATELAWPLLMALTLARAAGRVTNPDRSLPDLSIRPLETAYANENSRA